MKNIIITGIMILILLASTGCSGSGVSTKNNQKDIYTGTTGMTMNFMANAPPSKVYSGDSMEVVVELKNKGVYPDSDSFVGKLEISGFDKAAINGNWDGGNVIPPRLRGKTQYNQEGGYETMTYKAEDIRVPFDYDKYSTDIVINTCYKYRTIASPTVCIDPSPYKLVQEKKVCTIGDKSLGSQGAPVAVDRIEQEVSSDKLYFRIYIKNVEGGSVILDDQYDDCPFNLKHEDIDKVVVSAMLSHDASPSCTPRGDVYDPVRLVNGQGAIFCAFSKPGTESAYLAPLNIELRYTYSSSISKKIEIVNLK